MTAPPSLQTEEAQQYPMASSADPAAAQAPDRPAAKSMLGRASVAHSWGEDMLVAEVAEAGISAATGMAAEAEAEGRLVVEAEVGRPAEAGDAGEHSARRPTGASTSAAA